MGTQLPARRRANNSARLLAAPSAFVVLASRPFGADAAQIILRDTIEADQDSARRFALRILDGLQARYGANVDVQVFDRHGALVFACEQGGAL